MMSKSTTCDECASFKEWLDERAGIVLCSEHGEVCEERAEDCIDFDPNIDEEE
ncbi:unnamed protein product [marine sediment metagenome]|uniref:Uncharacterized protein n=1 Tax=marine sediment metagenome TaxID=412755 RepID=X1ILY1_9ZZZZ